MRLPQPQLDSPLFLFREADELLAALGERVDEQQAQEISALAKQGLPPIVSDEALATMIGINSGLIWSFRERPHRYYRRFEIPKGKGSRRIVAPKVGLKIIQKWLSVHLAIKYEPPGHVFGFVGGRSHIDAAKRHVGAEWAYSVDIEDFFGTTPVEAVKGALAHIGYSETAAELCSEFTCLDGVLAQGAPSSPVLSNMCFEDFDEKLVQLAAAHDATLTRYADDIVFSGTGDFNTGLRDDLRELFSGDSPWKLSKSKELLQPLKGRIKVHGLLVGPEQIRLTKGYRNRLRAYAHVVEAKGAKTTDLAMLKGHLQYALQVEATQPNSSGLKTDRVKRIIQASKRKSVLEGGPIAALRGVISMLLDSPR